VGGKKIMLKSVKSDIGREKEYDRCLKLNSIFLAWFN
jgi:hypothetical protein